MDKSKNFFYRKATTAQTTNNEDQMNKIDSEDKNVQNLSNKSKFSKSSQNSSIQSLQQVENPVIPKINLYGFETKGIVGAKSQDYEKKQQKHLNKWIEITKNWCKHCKAKNKLKRHIRKGIPDSFRGAVWYSLAKAKSYREKSTTKFKDYVKSDELDPKIDSQIKKDLNRTFPYNVYLKEGRGQESLYNVLKATALHVKEVGYCQGMGFVVATLLMYMGEEDSFWVLISMLKGKLNMGEMFKENFPLTRKRFFVFEKLIKRHYPKLHEHFVFNMILKNCKKVFIN
ncbi:hypothetical protein MHBO_001682 [Bonamia ostreae]|uniref:Rab-GAP TBC domain-containing protein n=1 Tax=Bonamia ostreae TaxID=126728 RepID=A0ABV2AJU4_9EUKA